MATRVYMTSRAIGTFLDGPLLGDWSGGDSTRDKRGRPHWTMLADASATTGGVITNMTAGNARTAAINQAIPCGNFSGSIRWATRRLDADTALSGTITVTHKTLNTFAASLAAVNGRLYAYVSVGDSLTERTPLIVNLNHATAWTGTATYREMSYSITGTVNALAGDRIILEVGARCSPPTAPAGDNAYTVKYGTTNNSQVVQADAVNGDTADRAAWIEFSETFAFAAAPSPPANDACADAIIIAATPYASAAIDTTESADLNRRAWWSFTPTTSGRYIFTNFGSNYETDIRVNTGLCAGLVSVDTQGVISWVGTGQSSIVWDATAGTTYTIWVQNSFTTAGTQAALTASNSGGSLQVQLHAYAPPADGDLFVNCQNIIAYRDGLIVNVQNGLYNDTPTNSAIDYSLEPMDDLNGGTNTTRRLYVDLFGSVPLIEILNLETLNVNEQEVDFIQNPIDYVGHSENLASIVFDQHEPATMPNIVMGYFGDNYDVVGELSTPDQCRINRMPSKNADNQTGAPWPNATAFTVDQDVGGSCYVELSNDRTTVYYTSSGREILTFDLDTDTQGPVFATLPAQGVDVPRPGARGLRLLPPYDGTGGLLVAYGPIVYHLNSSGGIVTSFAPAETSLFQDMDKIELSPDALSFYVSDQYSCNIAKFNIASGVQQTIGGEPYLETRQAPGQLCGFTIVGYRGEGQGPTGFSEVTEFPIRRLRRSPHTSLEQVRISIHKFQVDLQPGIGTETGQGVDPQVMFRFSHDGGRTWSNERRMSAGVLGNYIARAQTYRLGQGRDWVFEIVVSDPNVPWVILQGLFDPKPGLS